MLLFEQIDILGLITSLIFSIVIKLYIFKKKVDFRYGRCY